MKQKRPTVDVAISPKGRQSWYALVFVVALLVFAAGTIIAQAGRAMGWEVTLFKAVNSWSESWYRLFAIITFFGSTWAALLSVGLLFFAELYRLAWRLALSICGAYAIAFLAKHFIDRERPVDLLAHIHVRVTETGMGFPSGHATLIAVITLTLLPYLPKYWRWAIVSIPVAAVCLSRIYLGVHLPLDVVGGLAIGAGTVAFLRLLPQKIRVLLRIA